MQRRLILGMPLAGAAVGLAAGLLRPTAVLGAWPAALFDQSSADGLLEALLGGTRPASGAEVRVQAPDIAENGATVELGVDTGLADVESISLVIPRNPKPLIAMFNVGDRFAGSLSTRAKMAESSEVMALVRTRSGGAYLGTAKVKVTKGGCGG